jgi:hypothetical protein
MKNYIISESNFKFLIEKLSIKSRFGKRIVEVVKDENFDEGHPVYTYNSVGVLPDNYRPDKIGVVFFNGPVMNNSDYEVPEEDRYVTFVGPYGEFKLLSNIIRTKGKSPFIFGQDLINTKYYDDFAKLIISNKSDNYFSSSDIRKALSIAFKDYWEKEDDNFTEGIRGIHTIGSKTGNNDEDWSIMNYFDTKKEVISLITQKWEKEGSGDKIEWLSKTFKNDSNFLKKLLEIQWNSIKNGFETEDKTIKNIVRKFKEMGIEIEYEYYPPGHKKDRKDGIDFTIKLNGGKTFTIQVKPADKTQKSPEGIKVYTYGMKNMYKSKSDLDYIVYNKGDNFIFFKNKNYEVLSNGRIVVHFDMPTNINEIV